MGVIVVDDDAGHVLPGVGDLEVGIGQRGSRARDDEEQADFSMARRKGGIDYLIFLKNIQFYAVLRTLPPYFPYQTVYIDKVAT